MFGKILEVQTREITLENKKQSVDASLLGGYIVFIIDDKKVVAEVTLVSEKIIKCFLVGFIWQNRFYAGGNAPLSSDASIRPINADELALILGDNNLAGNSLVLGKSYLYEKFNVLVKLNDFFSFHNAIVGNTGSGKSCGLTRILQNLFLGINTPFNAHFVLFDAYGEYVNAFDMIKEKGLTIQKYSSINDFNLKNASAYTVARKNGWLDEMIWLKRKYVIRGFWQSRENVFNESHKYRTLKEFREGCSTAYYSAIRKGWLDEMT